MDEILRDLSASAVTAAIDANLSASRSIFGCLPGAEFHHDPDSTWYVTNVPSAVFNGVCFLLESPEAVDARIDRILAHFKMREVPMRWLIGPTTRPADLGKHLEVHGLHYAGRWLDMAADLLGLNEHLPVPPDLTIEEVRAEETLKYWCRTCAAGYQWPDVVADAFFEVFAGQGFGPQRLWRHYIGWFKGEAVATSSLFVGAGVAGIYWVATLPAARGQGAGTAIMLAPLRVARDMGYRLAILQATQIGEGVYRRVGFHDYCAVSLYSMETMTQ